MKNVAWKLVPGLVKFSRVFCKRESEEASVLILTNFESFANTYISNISSLLKKKINFPIKIVLNSLQTQKGLELDFRSQFLENLLIIFFLL